MPDQRLPSLNRDPNVVPMIDLLLVLLIIFMMYAIQQRMALALQLPQESTSEGAGPSIVLEVLPGPRYAINSSAVAPGALASELTRVFAGRPEKVLFVRGDRTVRYQDVVHAFDVARGAGIPVTGVVLRSP